MAKHLERKTNLPIAVLIAVLTALIAASASADFSGDSWRYLKSIQVQTDAESLVEVVPDDEVFAHGQPGLIDLRIIEDGSGREVPYEMLVDLGERRRSSIAATIRDLGQVPGQHTSFVIDLGREGVLHNELEVRTASSNFQRRVVVEGSKDGEVWAVLGDDAQIFDFTIRERNFTTRDTRIVYPVATSRYLRVRIIDENETPLDVAGAVVFFTQELPPRETEHAATILERPEDPEGRKTLLTLDLGSPGIPIHRLSVNTGGGNFYRQISLEGSRDAASWNRVLDSGTLFSYDTAKFTGSKLDISFRESTYRYYRLTIFNEDNPELPVVGALSHGLLRRIIFPVVPGETYALYYGKDEARAASYDLERIFPYLVTENLPQAQLGPHSLNPLFREPPEPAKQFTERYPWLLPTVVALASLLVGLFLTGLVRQIRGRLPPPGAPSS